MVNEPLTAIFAATVSAAAVPILDKIPIPV